MIEFWNDNGIYYFLKGHHVNSCVFIVQNGILDVVNVGMDDYKRIKG